MNKLLLITGTDSLVMEDELRNFAFNQALAGVHFECYSWPEVARSNRLPLPQDQVVAATYTLVDKLETSNIITCTHSDIVLLTIRLAVYLERISPDQVEIRWCDTTILLDKDARIANCPNKFFSQYNYLLNGLLGSKLQCFI